MITMKEGLIDLLIYGLIAIAYQDSTYKAKMAVYAVPNKDSAIISVHMVLEKKLSAIEFREINGK